MTRTALLDKVRVLGTDFFRIWWWYMTYDIITYVFSYLIYFFILVVFSVVWDASGFWFRDRDRTLLHNIILIVFVFGMLYLYVEHFDWCLHNVQNIVDFFFTHT